MLESGKVATASELAQKVKQERAFLFRALSLVNLAPDIIEAILNGIRPSPKATAGQEEPATLTLSKLRKGFPEDWTEQRKLFGMEIIQTNACWHYENVNRHLFFNLSNLRLVCKI